MEVPLIIRFLYLLSSEHVLTTQQLKIGMTRHPIERLQQYNTGDAPNAGLDKQYLRLYKLPDSVKTDAEHRYYEKLVHERYKNHRQKNSKGNDTEWFKDVDIKDVDSYLKAQGCTPFSQEEVNRINREAINRGSTILNKEKYEEEKKLIAYEESNLKLLNLKAKFLDKFLQGKKFRRIQDELWDLWWDVVQNDQNYKGIIQWVTGTGKTIAILILIVLAKYACEDKDKKYRGLLVTKQNNVFQTCKKHFDILSFFGIKVIPAYNGRFSSVSIPEDKHVLVMTTHQSLTESKNWNKLPAMNHFHYDEVHNITGDKFYSYLNPKLNEWNTQFITGTSATPLTSSNIQRTKISRLFGDPIQLLHKCNVNEAVREGWIAKPRFMVNIIPLEKQKIIRNLLAVLFDAIAKKQQSNQFKGGKGIVYLPTISLVINACAYMRLYPNLYPNIEVYSAVNGTEAKSDLAFQTDPADGKIRILFACQKYREGSDIFGIDITAVLMGNEVAANVMIQICGRALRLDYEGKEGLCLIIKPCAEGTKHDEVFESILLDIVRYIGITDRKPNKKEIEEIVHQYFGEVNINGKQYDIDDTIARIIAMYERKEAVPVEKTKPTKSKRNVKNTDKDMRNLGLQDGEIIRGECWKGCFREGRYNRELNVIVYNDKQYTPSAFLKANSQEIRPGNNRESWSGWDYCYVNRDGKWKSFTQIRNEKMNTL
jgi:superfamily II DNA or RNA helicase